MPDPKRSAWTHTLCNGCWSRHSGGGDGGLPDARRSREVLWVRKGLLGHLRAQGSPKAEVWRSASVRYVNLLLMRRAPL
jgi:hypothetical protein